MYALMVKSRLSTYFDFIVAFTAVNRSAVTWFKGYPGISATFGASRREHRAVGIVVATTDMLCLPYRAAWLTSFGIISVSSGLKIFLFRGCESELCFAIATQERLVLKTHRMTSFSKYLVRVGVTRHLE